VTVFHLARVGDDARQPLPVEVIAKQLKLRERRHLLPVEDGDARQFAPPEPLHVRLDQRVKDAGSSGRRDGAVAPRERGHDRQRQKHVGQLVGVGGGGGRLGVVLREAQRAGVAAAGRRDEERIEARRGHRTGVARIDGEQFLFLRRQAELSAEVGVGRGHLVGDVERLHQHAGALADEPVLLGGEEARPQDGAQEAVAEAEVAAALLFVEAGLGVTGEVVA
jgi:hypothetical protein